MIQYNRTQRTQQTQKLSTQKIRGGFLPSVVWTWVLTVLSADCSVYEMTMLVTSLTSVSLSLGAGLGVDISLVERERQAASYQLCHRQHTTGLW